MAERAELIRKLLPGLVLERVGVDGVEADAERFRALGQFPVVAHFVPGDMRRAGRGGARQLLDGRAILELVEDPARFADAGEAGEARAAGADGPRRRGDGESRDFFGDRLDVQAAPLKLSAERGVVVFERCGALGVLLANETVRYTVGHVASPFLGRGPAHACANLSRDVQTSPRKRDRVPRVDVQDIAGRFRRKIRGEINRPPRRFPRERRRPSTASAEDSDRF